jgi:hypothetical protein
MSFCNSKRVMMQVASRGFSTVGATTALRWIACTWSELADDRGVAWGAAPPPQAATKVAPSVRAINESVRRQFMVILRADDDHESSKARAEAAPTRHARRLGKPASDARLPPAK